MTSLRTVSESSATIVVDDTDKISRELSLFYNPAMKQNRDLSILVLKALGREELSACDLLAGTGVRSLRFAKELSPSTFSHITVNDVNPSFPERFIKNCELSQLPPSRFVITCQSARTLLAQPAMYDYIDIDPFGTPNPYLEPAIIKLKRDGLLAVTATDTAPLCGTYPLACKRKYWANPCRDHQMHEWALRILIRKAQLVGAQYDLALTPLLSTSTLHYLRVYLRLTKGKRAVDQLLAQHETVVTTGPLWTGSLHEEGFVQRMLEHSEPMSQAHKLLLLISEESKHNVVGFYDTHKESQRLALIAPPRTETVINKLIAQGFQATRTQFSGHGIKTNAPIEHFEQAMKNTKTTT